MMSKGKKAVLEEVKKLKLERKKVKDRLKAWADGNSEVYTEEGMRVGGVV